MVEFYLGSLVPTVQFSFLDQIQHFFGMGRIPKIVFYISECELGN